LGVNKIGTFYKFPGKAEEWFKPSAKIGQVEIDRALGKVEGDETVKILREQYKFLSQHTHPNIEAIQLETWDGEGSIGRKGILAGPVTSSHFPVQFQSLLVSALTATQMLGIVGLHEATKTWKADIIELRNAIQK